MVLLYIYITQISESDTILFDLDSVYYKYKIIVDDSIPHDSLFTIMELDTTISKGKGLKISGSKDFSFDMNQGVDQGLKVNITGEVEGINVEGNLSDKATSSSTMQISEVEKMSLRIFSKNVYGGIGNLTLDLPFGIQDEIQGARVGVHSSDKTNGLFASYAINRGSYKRMRFNGEEGKQSPYFLEGNIIIGSEKVYLAQGIDPPVLLKRDEDYSIDYEKAIISFTNKNVITHHSRIEVEYHQANEDYPNIYGESDGTIEFGKIKLTSMYRRRYDEKENPLTFTLSSTEIENLQNTGDSATVLHTYADTSSQGSYIFEDSHYVFVGEGNGEYDVVFFYVGENNGEYIYDPLIKAFSYRGPGLGNYSPTKYIPLPHQHDFCGIGVTIFNSIGLRAYASNLDNNTFSLVDDDDNFGTGYHATINNKSKLFTINGEYVVYHERLAMPHGKENIDYQYQWNTSEPLQEMACLTLGITPAPSLQIDCGYGLLNQTHTRKSLILRPFFLYFGYEDVNDIVKFFSGLKKTQGKFELKSRYEYVEKSRLFEYGIKYSLTKNTNIGVSGNYDSDTINKGITTILDITTSPLSLSFGHRTYNDTNFIFGNAILNIHYEGVALIGNLQQSQRYSQRKDETYVKVDEGKGNYVYDPLTGTYIEKEGGDYVKKILLLQEFDRVISRTYNIECAYSKSIFDVYGKMYYTDEEDFMNNNSSVVFGIGNEIYDFEITARQDITEDARYALYDISGQDRSLTLASSYNKFQGRIEMKRTIDEQNNIMREKKVSYNGELAYRIMEKPLIRPLAGYGYGILFSYFFQAMDIRLNTSKIGLLFGLPIGGRGRIELSGDIIYRKYNIADVPLLFSATEPAGFTRLFNIVARAGISDKTILHLIYRIEFPPEEKYNHNLRFQMQIRF